MNNNFSFRLLRKGFFGAFAFMIMSTNVHAQTLFKGLEHLFSTPKGYVAQYTVAAPVIDGHLNDTVWATALWSEPFVDIEGNKAPAPTFNTRFKMLWGDSCLYIAAAIEEPHVWATLHQHDAIIYHDNDFEVFIDPDNDTHQYFEIEVNALNTIFDLFMSKPYRNGSNALIPFNVASLQSAVAIQGTINEAGDRDSGWTVEMAIPFRSLTFGNTWKAPEETALWRINFSRVQWDTDIIDGKYVKRKNEQGRNLPEHNWVWSPQGVINMHYPERWGYLQFSRNANDTTFNLPYTEKQKQYLWLVYYRQQEFYGKNKRYARLFKELQLPSTLNIEGKLNLLRLHATDRQYTVFIQDKKYQWSLQEDGQVKSIK